MTQGKSLRPLNGFASQAVTCLRLSAAGCAAPSTLKLGGARLPRYIADRLRTLRARWASDSRGLARRRDELNPRFLAAAIALVLVGVGLLGLTWTLVSQSRRDRGSPAFAFGVYSMAALLALVGLALVALGVMFAGFEPQ